MIGNPNDVQTITPQRRRIEIDGIRGWAALSVVLFHLILETFGAVHPVLVSLNLNVILDGRLAVFVFFLLSGDALSIAFTERSGRAPSAKAVLKRYFRLAGPILFSCAVTYLLMRLGLTFNHEAASIVQRPDWLGQFLSFDPALLRMIRYSLIGVFTSHSPETSYNAFLWPMGIELAGSMIIFCLWIAYKEFRRPAIPILAAAVFLTLLGSPYALFLIGAGFGILRSEGLFSSLQRNLFLNRLATILMAAVLLAIHFLDLKYLPNFSNDPIKIALAAGIVFLCYCSADLLTFMRSRFSEFLGRISFPLYFMQFSVIVSWTSYCIVQGHAHPESIWVSPAAIVVSSFVLILGIATIVEAIEARYLRWLDTMVARNLRRYQNSSDFPSSEKNTTLV